MILQNEHDSQFGKSSFPRRLRSARDPELESFLVATLKLWSGQGGREEGYYGINQHRMESGSQGLTGRSHHNLQEPKIFKTRTIKIFESHCKTYGSPGWGSHKTLQSNKNINSKTDFNFFFLISDDDRRYEIMLRGRFKQSLHNCLHVILGQTACNLQKQ